MTTKTPHPNGTVGDVTGEQTPSHASAEGKVRVSCRNCDFEATFRDRDRDPEAIRERIEDVAAIHSNAAPHHDVRKSAVIVYSGP